MDNANTYNFMLKCKVDNGRYIKYFNDAKSMEKYIANNSKYLIAFIRYMMVNGFYRQIVIFKGYPITLADVELIIKGFVEEPKKDYVFGDEV